MGSPTFSEGYNGPPSVSRAGACVGKWAGPRVGLSRMVRAGSWEPPGAAGRAGHVGTHMGPHIGSQYLLLPPNIPTLVCSFLNFMSCPFEEEKEL